jgi:hypothetical protein
MTTQVNFDNPPPGLPSAEQRAIAVLKDLLPFMRKFRCGLVAKADPLRVAIVEPFGTPMPSGWKHSKQALPMKRKQVQGWREMAAGEWFHPQSQIQHPTAETVRQAEIVDAIAQVLRHFNCGLMAVANGKSPILVLAEHLMSGQWFGLVKVEQLDLYGCHYEPIKRETVQ